MTPAYDRPPKSEFRVVYSEVSLAHRSFETKNEAIQFALGVMSVPLADEDDQNVRTVFNGASGLSRTVFEGCGQRKLSDAELRGGALHGTEDEDQDPYK